MATPVHTPAPIRPHRPLAVAPRFRDDVGVVRRGAALALITAVLVGSCGVALATTAVLTDVWAVGLVVASAVLAGGLLAATAWRRSFC
jgi:hypothetical protein